MKRIRMIIAAAFLLIVAPLVFSCDTTEKKVPYFIINVKLDQLTYPVSSTNKLYAVFFVNFNWTTPWLNLSSSRLQIITPPLNIGDFPLFFIVFYDADNSGTLNSGDIFQGWDGVIVSGNNLTPIIVPETEMMLLNVDLDNNGIVP
ncbi:MAG: hypothetical protein A2176_08245 [Spirochaetes bacterium RBG_13_51_14]|nr:MAG: hypothetical protein A2176_08245 [Spirochaetes bacterium RBG_13_51_14]